MNQYLAISLFCSFFWNVAAAQNDCPFKGIKKIAANTNIAYAIKQLENESFELGYHKEDIPTILMQQLKCYNDDFSLANPDEEWNAGCVRFGGNTIPTRKLQVYAQCGDMMILAFLSGGVGVSTRIYIAHYGRRKVSIDGNNMYFKDIWTGTTLAPNITSISDLRGAVHKILRDSY